MTLCGYNHVVRPMGADSRNRDPTAEEAVRIEVMLDSLRAEASGAPWGRDHDRRDCGGAPLPRTGPEPMARGHIFV